MLSAPFPLLFDALVSAVSECSGADCGQIWGQKRFLTRGGRCLPVPAGKRFFVVLGLGYCTSEKAEMQVISAPQAYQFLARLYKEYSLAGGGPNSPAQEPTKTCSCALYRMIVVITRI